MDPVKPRAFLPAAAALAQRRVALSLFHTSNATRIATSAKIASRFGHTRVLYLHGGSLIPELRGASGERARVYRDSFAIFQEIWTTNAALEEAVAALGPPAVKVVSPFSAPEGKPPSHRLRDPDAQLDVLVAAYRGDELYGVDLAVETLDRLRKNGRRLSLVVLVYGGLSEFGEGLLRRLEGHDWVRVERELPPERVDLALDRADVLLRPTRTDGDALIVREALAKGTRVVASDTVPRPPGVELAEPAPDPLLEAIVTGGRVSGGEGLGVPLNREVLRLVDGS